MVGAFSFSFTNNKQCLAFTIGFVFPNKLPPSFWLPCDKPLRMLILQFPKQPAAGWSRVPHGRVIEAQAANPFQSRLNTR